DGASWSLHFRSRVTWAFASLPATLASRFLVSQLAPRATALLQLANCFAAYPYSEDACAAATFRQPELTKASAWVDVTNSVAAAAATRAAGRQTRRSIVRPLLDGSISTLPPWQRAEGDRAGARRCRQRLVSVR